MSLLYYMYMDYIFIWCELVVYLCQNSIKNKRHNYTLLHTLMTLTHYAIPREIYRRYSGDKHKVSRRKGQGVYRHSLTVEDCFRRETVCGPIAHLLSFPKKLTLVKFLFGLVARHLSAPANEPNVAASE